MPSWCKETTALLDTEICCLSAGRPNFEDLALLDFISREPSCHAMLATIPLHSIDIMLRHAEHALGFARIVDVPSEKLWEATGKLVDSIMSVSDEVSPQLYLELQQIRTQDGFYKRWLNDYLQQAPKLFKSMMQSQLYHTCSLLVSYYK